MSSGLGFGPSRHSNDEGSTRMGKLVVTEFVSLDGVMQAPGGEDFKYPGWRFEFDRGDDGNDSSSRRRSRPTCSWSGVSPTRASPAPGRRGRGIRRQVQHHAEVRRLVNPRGPGVEQHDGSQGRCRRGGSEAQGGARRDHSGPRKPSARAGATRARPRRRAAPDGLSGRPGHRKTTVRRDGRED